MGDAQFIGELTIGAVPSTIRELIPRSIKRLMTNYPDLYIYVVPELSENLYDQVSRGAVDAAIVSEPKNLEKTLHWQPIIEEQLVLLTAPHIKGNDPKQILQEQPYIRQNRLAAAGILADQWLSHHNINVNEVMVMDSIETLTSMVAHDLGVAIVPNICVPDPIFAKMKKVSLGDSSIPRVLGLLTRKDCSKIRLVERFQEEVETVLSLQ